MRLFDVSPAGAVLMMHSSWRATLSYQPPGETVERDASWFDWSILADLSADGRTILFNETREGGGAAGSVYLRRSDAAMPIRIGDGFGDAISPDGRWIVSHQGAKLVLLPTGAGEARALKLDGAFDLGAAWMPDGRHFVVAGARPGERYGLYLVDTTTEIVRQFTSGDMWGEAFRPFAISPDGSVVAAMNAKQQAQLYPLSGATPTAVNGVEAGEVPITFSPDGTQLYVARPTALPVRVFRITLATGQRELWKEFAALDPAGVYRIAPILMTRDAAAYAYGTLRNLSDVYVVDGLR
jgi:Tol biopolymer transport system component